MRKMMFGAALAAGMLFTGLVQAGDAAAAAESKPVEQIASGVCAGCHGPDGNAMIPTFPSLAGQWEDYLLKSLEEYKNGSRKDPVMGMQVKTLTQKDLENLAAFYAAKPSALTHTPLSE